MAYLHIANLYKEQDIFLFKECYAMEKIHGTSAHISFRKKVIPHFGARIVDGVMQTPTGPTLYEYEVRYFSGGEKHENFVKLFNEEELKRIFKETGIEELIIFGEAYGGKCQGMSKVYGKDLKFVAFEVKIGHNWLSVPQANEIVLSFGLDFVDYKKIPTTLEAIDKERERFSEQAIKNGMGSEHKREGVVLRPLIELRKNNGERIVSKHKNEEYRETKSKRTITDPEKLKVIEEANAVAEEWVTPMRLKHILDKIEKPSIEKMGDIIKSMIEDVQREGEKEIVWSKAVQKAIGKKTAQMVKEFFKERLIRIDRKEV